MSRALENYQQPLPASATVDAPRTENEEKKYALELECDSHWEK